MNSHEYDIFCLGLSAKYNGDGHSKKFYKEFLLECYWESAEYYAKRWRFIKAWHYVRQAEVRAGAGRNWPCRRKVLAAIFRT
jgi:hypothetical protein